MHFYLDAFGHQNGMVTDALSYFKTAETASNGIVELINHLILLDYVQCLRYWAKPSSTQVQLLVFSQETQINGAHAGEACSSEGASTLMPSSSNYYPCRAVTIKLE